MSLRYRAAAWIGVLVIATALVARERDATRRALLSEQMVSIWKAKYAEAASDVRHDSVAVVRTATRLKTLRDSFTFRDTLEVNRYITRYVTLTDTLIQQCLSCTESASKLHGSADSLIGHYADWHTADRRRWYDRLGVSVGYGFQLHDDGRVTRGPAVIASVKIWP